MGHATTSYLGAAITIFLVSFFIAPPARGELIDDFNDGNDDGWTRLDLLDLTGVGSANFDASSTQYVISSDGELPVLPEACNGAGAFWTPSLTDPQFANGTVRAKVSFDTDISNAFVALRLDAAGNGYDFAANNAVDRIFVDRLAGFVGLPGGLSSIPFTLETGEEYIIEGSAIGSQLAMKIWKVGDAEPATPQLMATDDTHDSGALWVAAYYCANPPVGGQLSARFDDVTFTVPEPSSALIAMVGCVCVSWMRCRSSSSRRRT